MNIGKHNKQMTEYRRLARRVLKQSKLYTYFDDSEFSEQTAFWRIKYKEGQPLTEDDLVKSLPYCVKQSTVLLVLKRLMYSL